MRKMNSKLLLVLVSSLPEVPGLSQSTQTLPFKIRSTDKPQKISKAQTYKLSFEIQNTSSDELTLCLLPGLSSYSWRWQNPNGFYSGTFRLGMGKEMIATS